MDGDLRTLLWSLNFYRASCSATKQKNKERERERERRELHLFNRLVQFSSVCFALDYSLAFYKMGLTIHDSPFM
jgi:hypothetical protein